MFGMCFWIFRMIAGQDQTLKEKSSFLNCLTHEDEGSEIFRNVASTCPMTERHTQKASVHSNAL
jgi:hypothetical protein